LTWWVTCRRLSARFSRLPLRLFFIFGRWIFADCGAPSALAGERRATVGQRPERRQLPRASSVGRTTPQTCGLCRSSAPISRLFGFVTLAGFTCFYCLPGECPAKRFQCLSLASPRSKTASYLLSVTMPSADLNKEFRLRASTSFPIQY
jgi:hypothetical protein